MNDSGYFFCPYIPLTQTPLVLNDNDEFVSIEPIEPFALEIGQGRDIIPRYQHIMDRVMQGLGVPQAFFDGANGQQGRITFTYTIGEEFGATYSNPKHIEDKHN